MHLTAANIFDVSVDSYKLNVSIKPEYSVHEHYLTFNRLLTNCITKLNDKMKNHPGGAVFKDTAILMFYNFMDIELRNERNYNLDFDYFMQVKVL